MTSSANPAKTNASISDGWGSASRGTIYNRYIREPFTACDKPGILFKWLVMAKSYWLSESFQFYCIKGHPCRAGAGDPSMTITPSEYSAIS
jgi:hypothetical protein